MAGKLIFIQNMIESLQDKIVLLEAAISALPDKLDEQITSLGLLNDKLALQYDELEAIALSSQSSVVSLNVTQGVSKKYSLLLADTTFNTSGAYVSILKVKSFAQGTLKLSAELSSVANYATKLVYSVNGGTNKTIGSVVSGDGKVIQTTTQIVAIGDTIEFFKYTATANNGTIYAANTCIEYDIIDMVGNGPFAVV